jgi:hypothetical protein
MYDISIIRSTYFDEITSQWPSRLVVLAFVIRWYHETHGIFRATLRNFILAHCPSCVAFTTRFGMSVDIRDQVYRTFPNPITRMRDQPETVCFRPLSLLLQYVGCLSERFGASQDILARSFQLVSPNQINVITYLSVIPENSIAHLFIRVIIHVHLLRTFEFLTR